MGSSAVFAGYWSHLSIDTGGTNQKAVTVRGDRLVRPTTTPVPRVTSPDSGNLLRVVAAIPNPNPLPINSVDQIDGTIDVYFNQAPTSPGTVYIRGKKPGLGIETPLGDASYSAGQTMIQVKITDFISPGTMPIRATVGYNDATAYQTAVTLVKGQ